MSRKIDALSSTYVQRLSDRLSAGEITLADWQIDMREELRRVHALQLIAGAGGDASQVTADDWLRLGPELRRQYGFLSDFGQAIQDGSVSGGQIGARAQMYAHSARTSYWRQATAGVDLPAQPGEGSECLTNCQCSWEEMGDGWHWILHASESCPTCEQRASQWNPYGSVN
jgi:hypothetical protein